MKVAIHQPNFLPWEGYFDKIKHVELFVHLDDVQFERGKTFTSRTKIIQNGTPIWLTVPVLNKSELLPIHSIQTDNSFNWQQKHLNTLFHAYKKSLNFNAIYPLIEELYDVKHDLLIDYNLKGIELISSYLNINTKFIRSSGLTKSDESGWSKIMDILKKTNATTYFSGSGSGSRRYINEQDLNDKNIKLEWQKYTAQTYPQLKTHLFEPNLSVIDKLFNTFHPGIT